MSSTFAEFDEIGYWSEVKLEIIRNYASAYSRILTSKKLPHIYVDAFAGAGTHIAKSTGGFVPGSPANALNVRSPFREYHFIDLNAAKLDHLQKLVGTRRDVTIYEGDCNRVLIDRIFPTLHFESYRRALCLLDPYGLNLKWQVILQAGQLGTIDMFLNFPVMGMNRNVLWRNPERVDPKRISRFNEFWGDGSWEQAAYSTTDNLFGIPEKATNEAVVTAFQKRLIEVAGFKRVPDPLPMRNSIGRTVYYLFFASQVDVAEHIVKDIFRKYMDIGED
ncbi:MAG: three-Cys-motif partner protein TcmP [Terriglobales bacterium]